ncbi:MAG: 50S ribosomal protein L10 [Alphaproteobacteria bacterium]|nr:50S ribosomal protein L10 [Alphaproteobacteria bacterium]
MDRTEKQAFVDDLHGSLKSANAVVVAHYAGLTVKDLTDLRGKLRKAGAQLKVSKNRLTKRALEGTPFGGIAPLLKGPTAIAFSDDVIASAKVAVAFAKDNEKFVILGGAMGDRALDAAGVKTLASMPSLPELRAKLLGLIQAPATKIAGVLQAPAGGLARVIGAYAKKPAA